jgi:cysteine synthase A
LDVNAHHYFVASVATIVVLVDPQRIQMASKKAFVPAVYDSFVDAVGNTPMIFLRGPSERTGCKIYGKAEFLNPGGSVKVRHLLGGHE